MSKDNEETITEMTFENNLDTVLQEIISDAGIAIRGAYRDRDKIIIKLQGSISETKKTQIENLVKLRIPHFKLTKSEEKVRVKAVKKAE